MCSAKKWKTLWAVLINCQLVSRKTVSIFGIVIYFKNNMRLKRTNIIVILIFVIWLSTLYITLTFRPLYSHETISNNDRQIERLERGISSQFESNRELISNAQKILELKKNASTNKSFLKELQDIKIPVLVFACNRITVTRCLDSLLLYRPDPDHFPIIVSQVRYLNIYVACMIFLW